MIAKHCGWLCPVRLRPWSVEVSPQFHRTIDMLRLPGDTAATLRDLATRIPADESLTVPNAYGVRSIDVTALAGVNEKLPPLRILYEFLAKKRLILVLAVLEAKPV
ncbi:MAG TPA: hypothetical protein VF787_20170 [Thermoanaerobaculia bacterium]